MQNPTVLGVLALTLLGAASPARADEMRALFGDWRYDVEGRVNDRGMRYEFDDDLDLRAQGRRGFALEVDTPAGGWPDMTFSYTPMGARGRHFEQVTFPVPSTHEILTSADFDAHELVVRWPLNRGPWRLSAGAVVERLRGSLIIDDSDDAQQRRQRYDEVFPLLHVQLRRSSRKYALEAVAQAISYDGSRATDFRAVVEARFLAPLDIQFGWQEKRYEIELSDYTLDARVSGPILRVGVSFRDAS